MRNWTSKSNEASEPTPEGGRNVASQPKKGLAVQTGCHAVRLHPQWENMKCRIPSSQVEKENKRLLYNLNGKMKG